MKILLPVDGSEPALDAVRHAIQLQRAGLAASFWLVAVQEPVYLYEVVLPPTPEVLDRFGGVVGAHFLAGAEALLLAAGVPYEREIASGEPAATLMAIAQREGCDAIVMGARGMGALRSAILGSVSQRVVHEASVPVTIVKHANA